MAVAGGAVAMRSRSGREAGPSTRATAETVAGAVAGGSARFVVAPLDVLKIRMQVQIESNNLVGFGSKGHYTGLAQAAARIIREEGVIALWRGTVPALLLWMPYTAIQFGSLGAFTRVAESRGLDVKHPTVTFALGAAAGAAATATTYPLDLLRTVMAAQGEPRAYRSFLEAGAAIVQKGGIRGLYAGMPPTLCEIIPCAGVQFSAFAMCKRLTQRVLGEREVPAGSVDFASGLFAGAAARAAVHPLDVIKKRVQIAGIPRHPRYGAPVSAAYRQSSLKCARLILAKEGILGFYKGLLPGLLKAAPASAITFTVYNAVVNLLSP